MKARSIRHHLGLVGTLAVSAVLFSGTAAAASSDARADYEAMRAACMSGQTTHQDQANCLREAGAALEEARRNRLTRGTTSSDFEANAMRRCERVPAHRRDECMALRDSSAVTVQGSVEGGGILRQRTLRYPADQRGTTGVPGPGTTSGMPVR